MKIIVFTSDKYTSLIKDFSYLFNKHWGKNQEVNILGFSPPRDKLPRNFKFISAGKQSDFPPKSFVEPFRPIIEKLETNVIVTMLEDAFLIDKVDHYLLEKSNQLINDKKADSIDLFLGADYQFASSKKFDEDFNIFPQNMNYRYSPCQKIYSKEYYLKYFTKNNKSIWELEVNNIPLSKNDGSNLLVSRKNPIAPWINTIVGGKWNKKHYSQMANSHTKRSFGWNKYQNLKEEEYQIFLNLKNQWS